jgi:hypothetical protein
MKTAIKMFPEFGWIETQRSQFGPFLVIKYIKNYSYQNMSIIKVIRPFLYSSMKKIRKIQLIFDLEKLL